MGCGESIPEDIPERPTAIKTSASKAQIATTVTITHETFQETDLRVLFIGPASTGKSTIGLQLDSLYGSIPASITTEYGKRIKQIVISDAKGVIEQIEKTGQKVSERLGKALHTVRDMPASEEALTLEIGTMISSLWADDAFKAAFEASPSGTVSENAEYFFQQVESIAQPDFKPSSEQIMMASIPTNGYKRHTIKVNQTNVEIIEVGGQKTQRESWHKTYSGIDMIIYMASLADFNQNLESDSNTSRPQDSLSLFAQIAANPIFAETPVLLLLNKKDLFERKLVKYFDWYKKSYPGFNGTDKDVEQAIEHVRQAYVRQLDTDRSPNAPVDCEVCNALNAEEIQKLFTKIGSMLLKISGKVTAKKACLTEETPVTAPVYVHEEQNEKEEVFVEAAPFVESNVQTVMTKVPAPNQEKDKKDSDDGSDDEADLSSGTSDLSDASDISDVSD